VPYFCQYDLSMEYVGHLESSGHGEAVFRGDAEAREFIAFWLRSGRVLAGMNVSIWDVSDIIQALVCTQVTSR
jgi:3-phenylpropionate/trans-cinnamate dioxygenase ferredoxin reductase subunit